MTQILAVVATIALVTGIAVLQMRQSRVRIIPTTLVPVVLLVTGAGLLDPGMFHHRVEVTIFAASVVLAVALGLARGASMRVWIVTSTAYRNGTRLTLALWITSLIIGFATSTAEQATHHAPPSQGLTIVLFLGLTIGSQNLVVLRRARTSRAASLTA